MGVIRFNDEEVFDTDSQEYEILFNAAKNIRGVEGAVVEIGTRRGGSAKIIIDALTENQDTNRAMFCIDPYGNIDYPETNKALTVFQPNRPKEGDPMSTETVNMIKHDYDNNMRNRIIPSLYYYAFSRGLNFTFFCLEDTEFFDRYADGVPIYQEHKQLVNDYAFVFFDGPHINEAVETELNFFLPRSVKGTTFVFDDIWMYDHDKFEKILFDSGFEILDKKKVKASYYKTV
jgi:hypothetical protein